MKIRAELDEVENLDFVNKLQFIEKKRVARDQAEVQFDGSDDEGF